MNHTKGNSTSLKRKRRSSAGNSSSSTKSSSNSTASASRSSSSAVSSSASQLLERLSEACGKHKEFHQRQIEQRQHRTESLDDHPHIHQDEQQEEDDTCSTTTTATTASMSSISIIHNNCTNDLMVLRGIIPRLEHDYQLDYTSIRQRIRGTIDHEDAEEEDHRQHRGGRQQNKLFSSQQQIRPCEVASLCLFYRKIVWGEFCPHSHDLLFDEGHGGKEIIPRVHQLFRHLASKPLVTDTISSILKPKHDKKSPSKEMDPITLHHISYTIAILLNSIPESSLQQAIMKDLILFLQDASVLDTILLRGMTTATTTSTTSSDDADNKKDMEEEEEFLEIEIFMETKLEQLRLEGESRRRSSSSSSSNKQQGGDKKKHQDSNRKKSKSSSSSTIKKEYLVEIGVDVGTASSTSEQQMQSLASSQIAIQHVLFHLLLLQHEKRLQKTSLTEKDLRQREDYFMSSSCCWYCPQTLGEFVLMDGELQSNFLSSIRQILLRRVLFLPSEVMEAPTSNTKTGSTVSLTKADYENMVLLLRNKVMASNLLFLLLPDLATCSERQSSSTSLWMELATLCTKAILRHLQFVSTISTVECSSDSNTYHSAIMKECDSISSILSFLLRDILICPLSPYNPTSCAMSSIRSCTVPNLLDTLPFVTSLVDNQDEHWSMPIENLCYILLRAVHTSLAPHTDSFKDINSNNGEYKIQCTDFYLGKDISHGEFYKLNKARDHCAANGLYPSLFALLKKPFNSTSTFLASVVTDIIVQLFQTCPLVARDGNQSMLCTDSTIDTMMEKTLKDVYHSASKTVSDTECSNVTIAINIINTVCLLELLAFTTSFQAIGNAFEIISIVPNLYKAVSIISESVSLSLTDDHDDDGLYKMVEVKKILSAMININGKNCLYIHDDIIQGLRKDMLQCISNCAMKYASQVTLEAQERNESSRLTTLDTLDDSLETEAANKTMAMEFDPIMIEMLSPEHEILLNGRKSQSQTHCKEICSEIRSLFGMHPYKTDCSLNECFCGIFATKSEHGNEEPIILSLRCIDLYLGHALSLHQRCVVFAFIHPVGNIESDGDGGQIMEPAKRYGATLSYVCQIIDPSSISHPEVRACSISCLPILLESLMKYNGLEERLQEKNPVAQHDESLHRPHTLNNQTLKKWSLTYFKTLLNEINVLNTFSKYISGNWVSESAFQRSTAKLAFECLGEIIRLYSKHFLRPSDYQQSGLSENGHPLQNGKSLVEHSEVVNLLRLGCREGYRPNTARDGGLACDVFRELVTNLILSINITGSLMSNSSHVRKAAWDFIILSLSILGDDEFQQLSDYIQPELQIGDEANTNNLASDSFDLGCDNSRMQSTTPLFWVLQTPLMDEDRVVRRHTSERIGSIIQTGDIKTLMWFSKEKADVKTNNENVGARRDSVISRFFDTIDEVLHKSCGLVQSQLSCTAKTSRTASTYGSIDDTEKFAPRQISAILTLSSFCRYVKFNDKDRAKFVEKGVLRLLRLWIGNLNMDNAHSALVDGESVSAAAFEELKLLHDGGYFNMNIVEFCKDTFFPGFFSEVLSKSALDKENAIQYFSALMQCIESFFLPSCKSISYEEVPSRIDRLYEIFEFTDKVLPTVITGLVLEQDYDALCSCTSFRRHLGIEIKRLEKESGMKKSTKEKIVGEVKKMKKQRRPSILFGTKDLKRMTSALCTSDIERLRVQSILLPRLFLHPHKAPLLFFLRIVLQEEVSLFTLLKQKELAVIQEIMWALADTDIDVKVDDCPIKNRSLWLQQHSNHHIITALKKGALIMKRGEVKVESGQSDNETSHSVDTFASLDVDETQKGSKAADEWVQKHFMMLLVNCITIRWRFGDTDSKVKSLRCLLVLLNFLRAVDSPQYMTQIFTVVDSAMNFQSISNDPLHFSSHLKYLGVKALGKFVTIVLSHDIKVVGDNLCKIVVGIFPLFEETDNKLTQYEELAKHEAIKLLELLVDSDKGRDLAPYFQRIPFFPKHVQLQSVRDSLKRNGIDFDCDLFTAQLASETSEQPRESLSSACSTISDGQNDTKVYRIALKNQSSLRKRLHSLKNLLNHENDNVRSVVLVQLSDVISRNRPLFNALVASEDSSNQFLTIDYQLDDEEGTQTVEDFESNIIKPIIEGLLNRCILETNIDNRTKLATCLGEIGAIDPTQIGQRVGVRKGRGLANDPTSIDNKWIVENGAPWKSESVKVHYELQLVTDHFVVCLKAAPTSTDQHRIAFAIQEVLKMLEKNGKQNKNDNEEDVNDQSPKEMNAWLKDQLSSAGVLSVIEPYWSSLYKQQEASSTKPPPFFSTSGSYFAWISSWVRFMIERSNKNNRSRYKDLFFACRSAIRSEAGIRVIEFLLPLLVLDSICFGDDSDRKTTTVELIGAISIDDMHRGMEKLQLQKVVAAVFMVLNTLHSWADNEIESRSKVQRGSISSRRIPEPLPDSTNWPLDESIVAIEDLVKAIPLSVCAQAASCVGMYAQALRFLEMDARRCEVDQIFERESQGDQTRKMKSLIDKKTVGSDHLKGIDTSLLHHLLGELSDCDSMTAISQSTSQENILDQIHECETYGDWNGVIQRCEQASQIDQFLNSENHIPSTKVTRTNNKSLATSHLKALLQLGQLEGTLNQVNGMTMTKRLNQLSVSQTEENMSHLLPFAVEASWRLSRWDFLQQLVVDPSEPIQLKCENKQLMDIEGEYNIEIGKALLGLQQRHEIGLNFALINARKSVMSALAVAARETYSRAHPFVLKLHCLREIEDASRALLSSNTSQANDDNLPPLFSGLVSSDWDWNERLLRTGNDFTASNGIINIRLALSRLVIEPELEASLQLTLGKKARKEGLYNVAANSLAHANSIYLNLEGKRGKKDTSLDFQSHLSEVRLQSAKIKYALGQSTLALQMIDNTDVQNFFNKSEDNLQKIINKMNEGKKFRLARNILQSTEWLVGGGMKSGAEVMARYRLVQKLLPKWERAHFCFAKYIDNVMKARIVTLSSKFDALADDDLVRTSVIEKDSSCQKYLFEAIKEYGKALHLGQKHLFQALPRLLSLWFEFTAIQSTQEQSSSSHLHMYQDKTNNLILNYVKSIPPTSYYNVLPQVISRVGHVDGDTVTLVVGILKRVLVKFPKQAMWLLAWLRNSVNSDRQKKGEEIFKKAQMCHKEFKNFDLHDLLGQSNHLFKYLIQIAKSNFKGQRDRCGIRPWKGAVELQEFMPPIQAALNISHDTNSKLSSSGRDAFPSLVPRMRTFSSTMQLMSSKARPKKITAFAVPAGSNSKIDAKKAGHRSPCDIGELHFLLKQEASGDLRKDARVQDLNNVINRLLATSAAGGNSKGKGQHRRLRLRTFSVICLSEDCGILEWVPNTDSFRNLVSKSYNPQTSHHCIRRRGKRVTDFNDPTLRSKFMKIQDVYFKSGNLTRASQMFEDDCLKEYPPLLYWWFVKKFQDPHEWFEARTKFAHSAAAWSAVGHVIGLGDRHSENILLDISSGECVHVDFDCIFDKGLHLPTPEVVPFRLTPNMLDAFGPTGANGTFSGGLVTAMKTLRDNRDVLLSVLEPFLRDPVIDWKNHKRKQNERSDAKTSDRKAVEAKRSVKVIEERLRGVYNLRNPNSRKIRRVDGQSLDEDDEMARSLPLSVEGQVHKMIIEASKHENLVQLYVGWMPWI